MPADDSASKVKDPPRNDWRTPGGNAFTLQPDGLWSTLHREYRFNVDAAANEANAKCVFYFDGLTPVSNGLTGSWAIPGDDPSATSVFLNPPYNPKGSVEAWLTQALVQAQLGVRSVVLVPMATSVAWFNDLIVPYAEWHSFRGRIAFEDPLVPADAPRTAKRTSPKQDNLLVIYNPQSTTLGHAAVRDAKTGRRLWTRPDLLQ